MANFTPTNQTVSSSYYVVADATPVLISMSETDGYENMSVQSFQIFDEGLATVKYFMRARDPDCVGVVYRYWTADDAPDSTAAFYASTRCGATPLTDIIVQKIILLC